MARPKKTVEAAEAQTYTVTEGNIVFDDAGNRCLAGDKVVLGDEAAATLKAVGVIK